MTRFRWVDTGAAHHGGNGHRSPDALPMALARFPEPRANFPIPSGGFLFISFPGYAQSYAFGCLVLGAQRYNSNSTLHVLLRSDRAMARSTAAST